MSYGHERLACKVAGRLPPVHPLFAPEPSTKKPRMLTPSKLRREHLDGVVIWLDFEKTMTDTEPAMGCELVNDELTTIVYDAQLAPAAQQKSLAVMPFREYVADLAQRVRAHKALLAAYTMAEHKVLVDADPTLAAFWHSVYFNARANPWFRHYQPTVQDRLEAQAAAKSDFDSVGLKDYLLAPEVRYPYPKRLRGFEPAKALRLVREQLAAKNGQYGSISDTAKARWTKLIEYNEHDVKGMRHLVEYMLTWEEKQRGQAKPN